MSRKRPPTTDIHPSQLPPNKTRVIATPSNLSTPSSPSPIGVRSCDIIHDVYSYMFRIRLDSQGSIAALCYLPTRLQSLVEFYHTEIPEGYRHAGLGDLLVKQAFEWAEANDLLVIPTCPFVQRYLNYHHHQQPLKLEYGGVVAYTEQEGIEQLASRDKHVTFPGIA